MSLSMAETVHQRAFLSFSVTEITSQFAGLNWQRSHRPCVILRPCTMAVLYSPMGGLYGHISSSAPLCAPRRTSTILTSSSGDPPTSTACMHPLRRARTPPTASPPLPTAPVCPAGVNQTSPGQWGHVRRTSCPFVRSQTVRDRPRRDRRASTAGGSDR